MNLKGDKGFSLLEVLIALVVLALGFTASLSILSSSSNSYSKVEHKTAAQWVGMNVIARTQLGLIPVSLNQSNIEGVDTMFNMEWRWRLVFASTERNNITRLTVDVAKQDAPDIVSHITGFMIIKAPR